MVQNLTEKQLQFIKDWPPNRDRMLRRLVFFPSILFTLLAVVMVFDVYLTKGVFSIALTAIALSAGAVFGAMGGDLDWRAREFYFQRLIKKFNDEISK
jgi:hypothetical protein